MKIKNPLVKLLPFWLFVFLFKFGAGLHYTLLSALGERIMPIWVVGLVVGAASFLQLIFDVPAGLLLDRYGYVRTLRLSTIAFVIGALVLVFGLTPFTYLLSIGLGVMGWLFYGPGTSAYVLVRAKGDEGGRYMGMLHAAASLGIVFAASALGFIISKESAVIGIVVALILTVSVAVLSFIRHDKSSVRNVTHKWKHHHVRREFLHKTIAAVRRLNPASGLLAVQNLVGSLFYGMIWFTVPLVIASGEESGLLGMGLSVFDLAIVILGAALGRLADRSDKKKLVFVGLFIFAVAGALLGFNFNLLFLFLGFLATAGDEMSLASLWSWFERLDKNHSQDGLINGVITLFEDIGWTIGPILAGLLYVSVGPSYTILIGAVPLALTFVFSVFFLRGKSALDPLPAGMSTDHPLRSRHKK